jgi:hypothetical protein
LGRVGTYSFKSFDALILLPSTTSPWTTTYSLHISPPIFLIYKQGLQHTPLDGKNVSFSPIFVANSQKKTLTHLVNTPASWSIDSTKLTRSAPTSSFSLIKCVSIPTCFFYHDGLSC